MNTEYRKVALGSGELEYAVAGTGAPVLYLHPAAGLRWGEVLEGLAKSHRVYAPIAPGFDARPRHGAVRTIKDLAALYGDFIDAVIAPAATGAPDQDPAPSCDLMGHSFGGWVAAWLAVLRPQRIGQLVLSSAAGFRPMDAPPPPTDPQARSRALMLYPQNAEPAPRTTAATDANRAMFLAYSAGLARDEELIARLAEIDRLTLILHGTADGIVAQESSQFLRSRIRRAFLVYIWDAAHAVETDQPQRMLSVTESFLTRAESFIVNWGTAALHAH